MVYGNKCFKTNMEDSDQNNADRLLKLLSDVENRIECLRGQALSIKREKESILGLLQDMPDTADQAGVTDVDKEDIENTSARLIIRCLSVDVTVSTPRNEMQEEAFQAVSQILEHLNIKLETTAEDQSHTIESYLNACLPEPFSSNIDSRFQSKVLGCAADDQKLFRKQLQAMHKNCLKDLMCNSNMKNRLVNGHKTSSVTPNVADEEQEEVGNCDTRDHCNT